MSRALPPHRVQDISRRLAELLAVPANRIGIEVGPAAGQPSAGKPDLWLSADHLKFAMQWQASEDAAGIAMAIRSLRPWTGKAGQQVIPVVAVPYLGETGRGLCAEAGVGWLDLSGNASLVAPGLRVSVEGKPNYFKRVGRPRTAFAPKSARIARWLLMEPDRVFTQRELAQATGMDEGFTSRIVRQLQALQLVDRTPRGRVRLADYAALLDAWRENYDFSKHELLRGHVAERSSDDILRRLTGAFKFAGLEHAITGLAGA